MVCFLLPSEQVSCSPWSRQCYDAVCGCVYGCAHSQWRTHPLGLHLACLSSSACLLLLLLRKAIASPWSIPGSVQSPSWGCHKLRSCCSWSLCWQAAACRCWFCNYAGLEKKVFCKYSACCALCLQQRWAPARLFHSWWDNNLSLPFPDPIHPFPGVIWNWTLTITSVFLSQEQLTWINLICVRWTKGCEDWGQIST